MFAPNRAAAYAKVSLETSVNTADPHKLILMLFDGALVAIRSAMISMQNQDIVAKGKSISHAIEIIGNGLKVSLDYEAGGELAQRLGALYDYMTTRLLHANLNNDQAALNEVANLLGEIKGAWENIGTAEASTV